MKTRKVFYIAALSFIFVLSPTFLGAAIAFLGLGLCVLL